MCEKQYVAMQRNKGRGYKQQRVYGVHIPTKELFNAHYCLFNGIYQNNTSNLVFEPSYNLNPFTNVYYGNHMDKIMIVIYSTKP